ncbi:MAG: hypothetical protein Ct9H300mP1_07520 [Planctomycetaceae bacterium]|nr:MAG: hypothetical protein Ct9H300mP1_07520 [Planctomycetaceae bacterium]
MNDWAQDLVELATRDNRRVVAFSETEIESLAELEIVLPPNLFVNALVIAKEWRRTFRSEALRQIQLPAKTMEELTQRQAAESPFPATKAIGGSITPGSAESRLLTCTLTDKSPED